MKRRRRRRSSSDRQSTRGKISSALRSFGIRPILPRERGRSVAWWTQSKERRCADLLAEVRGLSSRDLTVRLDGNPPGTATLVARRQPPFGFLRGSSPGNHMTLSDMAQPGYLPCPSLNEHAWLKSRAGAQTPRASATSFPASTNMIAGKREIRDIAMRTTGMVRRQYGQVVADCSADLLLKVRGF